MVSALSASILLQDVSLGGCFPEESGVAMKIALMSFNCGQNYGGLLQSWALSRVLEKMGHSVEVIDFHHPWSLQPYWWHWRSYVARTPGRVWRNVINMMRHLRRRYHFQRMEVFLKSKIVQRN